MGYAGGLRKFMPRTEPRAPVASRRGLRPPADPADGAEFTCAKFTCPAASLGGGGGHRWGGRGHGGAGGLSSSPCSAGKRGVRCAAAALASGGRSRAATAASCRRAPGTRPLRPRRGCAQGLARAGAAAAPLRRFLICFGAKKKRKGVRGAGRKKPSNAGKSKLFPSPLPAPALPVRPVGRRPPLPAGAQPRGTSSPRCPAGPALPARRRRRRPGEAARAIPSGPARRERRRRRRAGRPCAGLGAAHAAGRPRSGGAVRSAPPRRSRCPAGEVELRPSLSAVPRRRLLPPPPSNAPPAHFLFSSPLAAAPQARGSPGRRRGVVAPRKPPPPPPPDPLRQPGNQALWTFSEEVPR
ncbi:hippocalcin-like protein 1 isoform X2 [Falco cherrug]|uniref:hippocalcin-like protein 1 isoform X2 n=1 Tax=Falco cherrug TaxID=345164 RepID=UPI002478E82D|nr:hippocalcin-like protein 1 isoform X2 [Falco cherrug]XP_055569669.1 hippocalcin-like protein 1 isoform X2 [Falco cherrug]